MKGMWCLIAGIMASVIHPAAILEVTHDEH